MTVAEGQSFWVVEKDSVPLYLGESCGQWCWGHINNAVRLADRDSAIGLRTIIERMPGMAGRCAVTEHVFDDGNPKSSDAPLSGNYGHGHVWPRPDGVKARCGGPGICARCANDKARWEAANTRPEKS